MKWGNEFVLFQGITHNCGIGIWEFSTVRIT